jgi:glycosyltransferase involved in cell wall biosynthesis|tara:strand:- start:491 stop:1168 length:678 start_codon:yes stop_codon:yes gene_type:complete
MKFKDIYVIVPAFNEQNVIKDIINNLLKNFSNVIVINDGSNDKTLEIINDLDIKILSHEINLGVGAAVQTGFDYVSNIPDAKAVITFDADGQHLVDDAIAMAKEILICDEGIIFGTRFPKHSKNIPKVKRIVLKLIAKITDLVTGVTLSDAHNGLKAYKVSTIKELELQFSSYSYESELITQVAKKKIEYKEMSTDIKYTSYSIKKGQKLLNGLLIIEDLLKLWK